MKNIFKIGLVAFASLIIFVSCQEDDALADPNPSFVSVRLTENTDAVGFIGETISIALELRSALGISALTANGVAVTLDDEIIGETQASVDFDFTVPTGTTIGSDIEVVFVLTDAEGNTSSTTFTIKTDENPSTFSEIDLIDLGDGEGAAEISAYDTATMQLFVVNNDDVAGNNRIDVIDFSDPSSISLVTSIELASFGGGANSVAAASGLLAVAVEANTAQDNGSVLVYNTSTLTAAPTVISVGALPDMVTFSPDGEWILVANEGEPSDDYTVDPEGSVSIISVPLDDDGVPSGAPSLSGTATFTSFNDKEAELEMDGLRVFGPNASLAQDLEPEYISISADSETAYVTLQENNGVAIVDIEDATVTAIAPLGFKDYTKAENAIDPSNADGIVAFRSNVNFPLFGTYQPDAIATYTTGGTEYLITANEGDARDYDGFVGESRAADIMLDAGVFSDAAVQQDENYGRLNVMLDLGDTDGDGDYDALYSYGARSFSIWGTDGSLVFDSGNELDVLANNLGIYSDGRSDDKGVEPESVIVGSYGDRSFAFIGLERVDAVAVYEVTNPSAPSYITMIETGDAPEGLVFIPASQSPNSKSLLVVSSEDDGTVRVYETD
ncbi:MAG: choice-of-anchor I family protein [Bacteroidota bacterium]